MEFGGLMGDVRPRGVAGAAISGLGGLAVATGLIPIHGGRSTEAADLATASCVQKLRAQHGGRWDFAADVKINGGDSPDAIVRGTATHANGNLIFVCNTRHEGGKVWQATSIRTFAPTS
jgi:hypothetical protein